MDPIKRRTLKVIAGVSAASVCASTAATGTAFAAGLIPAATLPENNSCGHLSIQIIAGKAAPEDTVILVNDTNKEILVHEFLPGLITQNNQMIDLNSLLTDGDMLIKPGYPVASKAARWEVLSIESGNSYLWCDTAVSKLSGSETGIISIHAAVVNGRAMLTAEHEELALS